MVALHFNWSWWLALQKFSLNMLQLCLYILGEFFETGESDNIEQPGFIM